MALRQAKPADFKALLQLNHDLIAVNPLTTQRLRHYLSSPTCRVIVADDDGIIRGAAIAEFHQGWKRAYLATIFVARDVQGHGYARLLLESLEEEARARGMRYFASHAATHNKPSVAFHTKLGFQSERIIEGYYDDGSSAIFFRKEL